MKIVKIDGGLGNQMFQYAFARKLKHLFPSDKILIDITNFKGQTDRRYELKYVFDVDIPVANSIQISQFTFPFSTNTKWGGRIHGHLGKFINRNIYTEKRPNYFSFSEEPLSISHSCYYSGVWFNESYFIDIKNEIRDAFTFKRPLSSFYQEVKKSIESTNSVSIHVRRGDYLLLDAYKGICEKDYYEKAIKYIKAKVDNPHYFVFSNDIRWCRENLTDLMFNDIYSFVENNDTKNNYIDMQLMACCKHNIIAHSSFSWWATWLNCNPDKKVVAPLRWINSPDIKESRPQLKDWILIE